MTPTDPLLLTPVFTALIPLLLTGAPSVYFATQYLTTLLEDEGGLKVERLTKRLLALTVAAVYTALYSALGGLHGGALDEAPRWLVLGLSVIGLTVLAGGAKDSRRGQGA